MAEKEDVEKGEGEEGEAAAPKKSNKKLLIIIIAAAVLLIGGAIAAVLLLGGSAPEETEEEVEHEVVYQRVDLGEFTVNLASTTHFLKTKLVVEYDPVLVMGGGHGKGGGGAYGGGGMEAAPAKGGLPGVLGEREAMVRDAIIRVLSSKTMEDVLTETGKDNLKEELLQGINEALALERDAIVAIYFQEFLVQ